MALVLSLVIVSIAAVVLSGATAYFHGGHRLLRLQLKAYGASLGAEKNLSEAREDQIHALKDIIAVQEKQLKHKDAIIQGLEAEVKQLKSGKSILRPDPALAKNPPPPKLTKSQLDAAKNGLLSIVKDLSA